jgi:GNAT superfamily N-acetyltransferase
MIRPMRETRGEFELDTDRGRVPIETVHRWLSDESYWARGIPLETVRRSIEHALPFGIYEIGAAGTAGGAERGELVAFLRVITDYATFAYVGDVFVRSDRRGRGLSKWLMEAIHAHPELQGFRRWILATHDAHGLYLQSGYQPLERPQNWLERRPMRSYVDTAD